MIHPLPAHPEELLSAELVEASKLRLEGQALCVVRDGPSTSSVPPHHERILDTGIPLRLFQSQSLLTMSGGAE